MGLLRGARWRSEGVAWTLVAAVGALLLGLGRAQPPSPPAVCPTGVTPSGLTQPQYQANPAADSGVGFMKDLVQSFLKTVQPKPFPEDLILRFVKEFEQIQSNPSDIIKSTLLYEIGFLVCAAIGVVYIVLVVLVGFFMACCRCCGNCGGAMYQKQTSSISCRRRTLYWSAFLTTLIILAGNVCMFQSNEAFRTSVDGSVAEVNSTLGNLHTYLASVPQEIDRVVNESYKTVDEVTKSLDSIGPLLGKEIQEGLKGPLDPALASVRVMSEDAVSADGHLRELNASLARLQASVDLLQANVSAVKERIHRTISRPACSGCGVLRPEMDKLTLEDATITIPRLSEFQSAVSEVVKADLDSKVKMAEDYFNSIPQTVTNDTKDVVQSAKQQLGEIKRQISQVTNDIPVSGLKNVSHILEQLEENLTEHKPQLDRVEYIRWAVGVAICCVVLLVVLCNTLGLLLGPVGLSPKVNPVQRSCTSDCGGTFFMMSAGFSFLFAWLFMILVLLLFLVGGNMFTLVCRPWSNGGLLEFIDTPGLIPDFQLGPMLGLETDLNITDVYRDCEQNKPLWSTLHLYELIDLDHLLNVSRYTDEIQQHFDNADITLSTITLLTPEVQDQLTSFSGQAKDVDFSTATQKINNITNINLNTTADKLDELANFQTDPIQTELREEARDLRQIQSDMQRTLHPQLEELSASVEKLRSTTEKINVTVGNVLSKVGAAQDFLNTNTTAIVKTESREFLNCQMGYFIAYVNWANLTIREQVGRCGPVAGAVDSVEIIVCSHIVASLNAFWFSLGWCLMFFIPSMIFSIKLAKYYRRMDQSDVLDNHIAMNHIPRPQMKPY